MKIMVFQDFEVWKPSRNGCNHTSGTLDYAYLWCFRAIKNIREKIFFARPIYIDGFRWWKTADHWKSQDRPKINENPWKSWFFKISLCGNRVETVATARLGHLIRFIYGVSEPYKIFWQIYFLLDLYILVVFDDGKLQIPWNPSFWTKNNENPWKSWNLLFPIIENHQYT